ncbi:hypothetical protein B296_00027983 [Ensete ventricosum]|uniref:Uncharacterized protein n=1 Tax=Ensete ventricosum TaxID=4639 RepID=A0A426ZB20_ENSVE|nr:hypothetical protein B296_00027983 [Ensete ventricosum]
MKYNPRVSGSWREYRKEHFAAPSNVRSVLMSAPLSADHRNKYNARSVPVRKDEEVYRRKWVIHIDRITREKVNSTTVKVNINLCKVVIKLKLDKYRKAYGNFSAEKVAAGASSLQKDD